MRKNKMMRLASALLVAVLLTTCAISGTFAKYVTEGSANDSARVAKWGVTITGKTAADNEMFVEEYNDNDADYSGLSVQATVDVVAPGTEGTFAQFTVAGTPEVAVRVTYTANLTLENWTKWDHDDDSATPEVDYCPIEITVGTETFKIDYTDADMDSIAELEAAVEAAILAKKADYQPNVNLTAVNDDLAISWAWDFEGNSDAQDTILGDNAATGTAATIALNVGIIITQID